MRKDIGYGAGEDSPAHTASICTRRRTDEDSEITTALRFQFCPAFSVSGTGPDFALHKIAARGTSGAAAGLIPFLDFAKFAEPGWPPAEWGFYDPAEELPRNGLRNFGCSGIAGGARLQKFQLKRYNYGVRICTEKKPVQWGGLSGQARIEQFLGARSFPPERAALFGGRFRDAPWAACDRFGRCGAHRITLTRAKWLSGRMAVPNRPPVC